ncbi:MAG: bifunctional UDP-sugar hydrolase/5'-nucleotidase UshA [Granulosicoccaceae bacterium]
MHRSVALLIVLVLAGCSQLNVWKPDTSYKITLLHTNDHHGRFWENRHGEYGLAARKTLIDRIRAEVSEAGGHVLLLSGGDINTGVPESDLQDAEPDFRGMSALGYDAMAVGNHEFDNPLTVLSQQQEWANFPFLAANILDAKGNPLFQPYEMFNLGGVKVAVMGLTTDDTARLGNPEFIEGLDFLSPVESARQLLPELRAKADIVVAATHMGHYDNAKHGLNAPGDVTLARSVDGLDVIVGGHSQDPVCMASENIRNTDYKAGDACVPDTQNGTLILQAHEWGKYVGRADFEFINGELSLLNYELIPVNLKKKVKNAEGEKVRVYVREEILADAELKAMLQPFQDKGQEQLQVVIGSVDGDLIGDRDQVRFHPTNLGFLIAEAQRAKVGADVAVMNSGGIRAGIEAGDIAYKDVLTTQPFGNAVCFIELSGAELSEYLAVAASKPIDTGAYAQFAGVDIDISGGEMVSAKVEGKDIDPSGTYRLALNSYLASGGDGYPRMDSHPGYVNTGFVDADALREYVENNTPLSVADLVPSNVIRR